MSQIFNNPSFLPTTEDSNPSSLLFVASDSRHHQMSVLNVRNEIDDGWKEEMVHADCARLFFNESHHVTKERFFRVCCRTWMEELFVCTADDTGKVTYEFLWKTLTRIYISSKNAEDSSSVITWILPDISPTSFVDPNSNANHDVGNEGKYRASLMNFWSELFKAFDDEYPAASQNYENDKKRKRANKRRRLGPNRFTPLGFKNLLKGRYKLPAIYLMISLYKQIGIADDWLTLCDLAHKLPSIFKTFAENDILAGLALVGLAEIGTGKLLAGLSASTLITEYFSGIE